MQRRRRSPKLRRLSSKEMAALRNYKYTSGDNSITLNNVLDPYLHTPISKKLPLWLAPNLVTLIGFAGFCTPFLLCSLWFCPGRQCNVETTPSWPFVALGLGLFFYQTMDGIDGKQARRTGSSSPLGEFCDHSVDAINTSLGVFASSMSVGAPFEVGLLYLFANGTQMFALATWEALHTGSLILPEINGPIEGVLTACVLMIATGLCGLSLWTRPCPIDIDFGDGFLSHVVPGLGPARPLALGEFVIAVRHSPKAVHAPSRIYHTNLDCSNVMLSHRCGQDNLFSFSSTLPHAVSDQDSALNSDNAKEDGREGNG